MASGLCLLLLLVIFVLASFPVAAWIAHALELAFMAGGGCLPAFNVLVVTPLTSMKFIIALLVQEVKR
jgi:hypothetical protein